MKVKFSIAFSIAAMIALLFSSVAFASVWTDQQDYSPGDLVTINGDNSNGVGYMPGESVHVEINGPNNYFSSCDAIVDEFGMWSCQVNLWPDSLAVGSYFYTAIGLTSSVRETGTFTDGNASVSGIVKDTNDSPLGGVTVSCTTSSGCNANLSTTTDANGAYFFDGKSGHGPKLTFSTSGPVSLTITASKSGYTSSSLSLSNVNNGDSKSLNFILASSDSTPPVITYVLTPSSPDGSNGWYKSNVSLVWSVTDPESTFTKTGCVDQSITTDQAATAYSCSATSSGGTASLVTVTIKRDATAPTVTITPARNPDHDGWYTSPIGFSVTGNDSLSDNVVCDSNFTYSGPESASVSGSKSCTDAAGNSGTGTYSLKYDATGPTAILSVTAGTPGSNGWYTSDVTVHTSGSDISPVTCTGNQYQTTETTGAVFNGSCTNDAGLTTNAAPLTVKLDKTAPSAVMTVTAGTAGTNGWYTSDVTVSTSGTDSISGPANCTADQYQTSETAGTVFNGSCTNDAGLMTDAASLTVKLDKTGPSAALAVTAGTVGLNGWYTSDVTVSTSGSDLISDSVTCTSDQFQTSETTGAVFNGSCINGAGLTTNATPITVKLDKTAPSADLAVTAGTPGSNGWYTSDVTISTTGIDDVSNPVTCSAAQYQTTETAGIAFNGSCTNDAGLTTNATPLLVKLDKTGPTAILGVTAGTSGTNGWYTSDVTLSTSGSDSISNPVTCTADQFQTSETTGATFNGSCTNDAGLMTNAAPLTVKLDKTGPTAALAVTAGNAGLNGWYTSDVTISTSGSDSISSPVSCTADQYQTSETTGVDFDGSCTNDAGLKTDAASLTVKLDKTAPSAALVVTTGTTGTNGWYTSDVTIHTTGTDSISTPVTCTVDQFQTTETAGVIFNGSCTNDAGLTTNAAPLTVKLDKTGPTAALAVTAGTLGLDGWYTSDVTVSTSGSDSISSPVTCTADQYLVVDTGGATFNGSCTNDAGLTTNAAPLTVKLDKTAPTITWNGGPADGANYYFGFIPAAPTCTAFDLLSGPKECNVTGYSLLVGSHTLTATAYDMAGNSKVESRTYTVLAWTLTGFYRPVDMNGVLNVAKNGSTVPLKFNIYAGTTELTTVSSAKSLQYSLIKCDLTAPEDPVDTLATGGTVLRYDSSGGQFVYNWKTPNTAGKCYSVTMTTWDGSNLTAYFKLK